MSAPWLTAVFVVGLVVVGYVDYFREKMIMKGLCEASDNSPNVLAFVVSARSVFACLGVFVFAEWVNEGAWRLWAIFITMAAVVTMLSINRRIEVKYGISEETEIFSITNVLWWQRTKLAFMGDVFDIRGREDHMSDLKSGFIDVRGSDGEWTTICGTGGLNQIMLPSLGDRKWRECIVSWLQHFREREESKRKEGE